MIAKSRRLKVKRFIQDPSHCAVAACAMVANYYNSDIDYEFCKALTYEKINKPKNIYFDGLYTGECCLLLHYLGFKKIHVVSSNIDLFDYSWKNISKKELIFNLTKMKKKYKGKEEELKDLNSLQKFLRFASRNRLIVDFKFAKYIKKYINQGIPILASINWTVFFEYAKYNEDGNPDPIFGDPEQHVFVITGYNDKGVMIVDSHQEYYKYSRKKYRKGYYTILWEELMVIIGIVGDIVIPMDYSNDLV